MGRQRRGTAREGGLRHLHGPRRRGEGPAEPSLHLLLQGSASMKSTSSPLIVSIIAVTANENEAQGARRRIFNSQISRLAQMQVAAGGCGHGLCVRCAYQLCARGLALPACPFCRATINSFEPAPEDAGPCGDAPCRDACGNACGDPSSDVCRDACGGMAQLDEGPENEGYEKATVTRKAAEGCAADCGLPPAAAAAAAATDVQEIA